MARPLAEALGVQAPVDPPDVPPSGSPSVDLSDALRALGERIDALDSRIGPRVPDPVSWRSGGLGAGGALDVYRSNLERLGRERETERVDEARRLRDEEERRARSCRVGEVLAELARGLQTRREQLQRELDAPVPIPDAVFRSEVLAAIGGGAALLLPHLNASERGQDLRGPALLLLGFAGYGFGVGRVRAERRRALEQVEDRLLAVRREMAEMQ